MIEIVSKTEDFSPASPLKVVVQGFETLQDGSTVNIAE
jgi:hypothetical protein